MHARQRDDSHLHTHIPVPLCAEPASGGPTLPQPPTPRPLVITCARETCPARPQCPTRPLSSTPRTLGTSGSQPPPRPTRPLTWTCCSRVARSRGGDPGLGAPTRAEATGTAAAEGPARHMRTSLMRLLFQGAYAHHFDTSFVPRGMACVWPSHTERCVRPQRIARSVTRTQRQSGPSKPVGAVFKGKILWSCRSRMSGHPWHPWHSRSLEGTPS